VWSVYCLFLTAPVASVDAMLIPTVLHAEISGNVASVGYVLGGLGVLAVAAVLFLGIHLIRSRMTVNDENPRD